MITIEEARPEDLPAAARLLGILLDQEHEFTSDAATQLRGLKLIQGQPQIGLLLVAREQEQVLGFANLLWIPSTALGGWTAHLDDFIIDPARRGEGLGDQLFQACLAHARQRGCLRLTLQTDHDNHAAQKLYRKHGLMQSSMVLFKREWPQLPTDAAMN